MEKNDVVAWIMDDFLVLMTSTEMAYAAENPFFPANERVAALP
jgi:hypothetical protein